MLVISSVALGLAKCDKVTEKMLNNGYDKEDQKKK